MDLDHHKECIYCSCLIVAAQGCSLYRKLLILNFNVSLTI